MNIRQVLGRHPPYRPTARAFSHTALAGRAPSLGDLTPDGGAAFEARSKKFRAAVQEKALQKSQFANASAFTSSAPSLAPSSDPPSSASLAPNSSSHASHGAAASAAHPAQEDGSKRKGALSSLIYGTHEGQQMDKEIERSFSQVLSRGKYVHSIVFHKVKPDKVDEYTELVGQWYPRMAKKEKNRVNLVGSWRTEVGDCDTFSQFPLPKTLQTSKRSNSRYQGYHASLHSIASHPEFPAFDSKLKTLISSKKTSLMQEFSFWPTTSPRQLGGLFELRSYTLHPGNLLEWESHWRRGLKARREVMEGVGAWFVQIGELNTVHHLWQFADLEERKLRRERSWGIEGWGETVHKTVPLIQSMRSRILIPMPWSPVA
ncbi:MAG: hypothetical protein M1829_006448 [Trizodia sp. TS-e1964]|nr:MAG: hypothetical protein M1829_006448 [Trizodia sp. TS-e1964]